MMMNYLIFVLLATAGAYTDPEDVAHDEILLDYYETPGVMPLDREAYSGPWPWWGPEKASDAAEFADLRSQLFEGDILVPLGRNAIRDQKYLWPGGVIPYKVHEPDFRGNMTEILRNAFHVIESQTCIRFVKYNGKQQQYVYIRSQVGKGCVAAIGRSPGRKVFPMNLQYPDCFLGKGIAAHELLHVVGLLHEQSRPDRDDYVDLHPENIDPTYYMQFAKVDPKEVSTYGLSYDYTSVMHYPKWAFTKNGKDTITAKHNPDMILGQRKGPTEQDLEKVRRMYNCDRRGNRKPPKKENV